MRNMYESWERVLIIEQNFFPSDIASRGVENKITAPLWHVIRGKKIGWATGKQPLPVEKYHCYENSDK
jgi:hypothetical protein